MLKTAFLAGAALISSAALAQTAPADVQTAPAAAIDTAPAPSAEPPLTTTDATPTAAVQPASGGQVAQIVDSEFPNYDRNADGKLDKTEFSAWMVALKSKSDPATKAEAPTTVAWVGQAFKQADADKSAGVSKPELTSFLSQGAE